LNPVTGKLVGDDITSQTKQALTNLQAILQEAGSDLSKVVKTTVLLKNMADYPTVNGIYAQYFNMDYPARSAFAVAALPANALIEIEAIAMV
jgi:2-iminobutanoate/2-iminopropanoate deaminase